MYFSYLSGKVAEIENNTVTIDCSGVGYECVTSGYTISQLKLGDQKRLYTFCSVREDAFEIFGFSTKEEKSCFEMLISVNGVGPKAAIAILSACTPSSLKLAIAGGDEKTIVAAQGIGKKLAQRIILELKDKVSVDGIADSSAVTVVTPNSTNSSQREAVAALASLGYSQGEITQVLKAINTENMRTEDIVRSALRAMVMKS